MTLHLKYFVCWLQKKCPANAVKVHGVGCPPSPGWLHFLLGAWVAQNFLPTIAFRTQFVVSHGVVTCLPQNPAAAAFVLQSSDLHTFFFVCVEQNLL